LLTATDVTEVVGAAVGVTAIGDRTVTLCGACAASYGSSR